MSAPLRFGVFITPFHPIGQSPTVALEYDMERVVALDRLGFDEAWFGEHHSGGYELIACPEVFIAAAAERTKHIRLGSGGIMLPNHSTLKVAENFRLLEALYPHRIDLGLGRAPGGDRVTAQLLNPSNTFDPQEYIQQIKDLDAFLSDASTPGTIGGKVRAIPHIDTRPELWMLTSSGESAYLAAHFGMALSYAQFINPIGAAAAIQAYKDKFRPSPQLSSPKASVGIFAFCSDDPQKIEEAQAVMDYRLYNFERGRFDEIPSYELAKEHKYTDAGWQRVLFNRQRMAVGTPQQMRQRLGALAEETGVDELVISTFTEHFADRLRSYELLATTFGLKPHSAAAAAQEHQYHRNSL